MFTGLIEERGKVRAAGVVNGTKILTIEAPSTAPRLSEGDSVSVNGVCLTAIEISGSSFSAQITSETLEKSTLGSLMADTHVNIELPLSADGRFGGHIVQGHTDGVAAVEAVDHQEDGARIDLEASPELARYIVEKGSVALDGVSLTVASVRGIRFSVALIPHTLSETTLGGLAPGDRVNVEVDIMAKYVERMLEERA